jgi:S1-C subfamily serine protease
MVLSLAVLLAGAATAAAADGWLGVQVKKGDNDSGIVVVEPLPDGPAAKAGIKANDLITKIDGKDYKDLQEFIAAVRALKPGAKAKITLYRDGEVKEIEVTVGEKPEP